MSIIPAYSMLASTATTLMLCIIFLILSYQSDKHYMRLWGVSWLICSVMFFLDFINLNMPMHEISYAMFRQQAALTSAYLFLLGTFRFFQMKFPGILHLLTVASLILITVYPASYSVFSLAVIPNVVYSSGLMIIAGCMFISISWTQKLPEKLLASFFIILWSIFINCFGFSLGENILATYTYFISIFTVNILMLILIIIYFKKQRFLDAKQSSRFRLLVENSSNSMFLYDYKNQKFEYISPGISKLIGLTDSQLYNMPERFFDYVNTEKKYKDILYIFSRPVSKPGNGILSLYRRGNIEKWSEIHYIPIRDNTGTVTAVEGILRDITQEKKMEEGIKAAQQAKQEFLEDISHEIKTPITLIQGYADSLLDNVVPPESSNTYLKMINSKAMMLTTLLDDLRQASDFSSQSLEYKFYEQPAASLLGDLVNQGEFHITTSGRRAVTSSDIPEEAVIIADSYRIQQVVSNIINNAIRHTPAGGEIRVDCRACPDENLSKRDDDLSLQDVPEGEIVFTVSDRGSGISPEDLPHIFERNFSGGKKLNRGRKGRSGLGLYISKQIISQHSGTISAKNNSMGGAEIAFTIPYYR